MRTHTRREREIRRCSADGPRGWASARGFSIIELVVVIMLAALAVGIAFATLNSPGQSPQNLAADLQDFSLNLQTARELGISRGAHYRVRVSGTSTYVMEYQDSGWVTDRSLSLRPNVTFDAGDVGKIAEFDTRGLCVSSPPITFTLSDTGRRWSKQVTVSAGGMVDRQ